MRVIVYDIEILRAIPPKDPRDRLPGIEYCAGWRDFQNMGIACIGAYDFSEDRYRVFSEGNFQGFIDLIAAADVVAGFNSILFDNEVLRATFGGPFTFGDGIDRDKKFYDALADLDSKSYDLLRETWVAAGLSPTFQRETHMGYGLDDVCRANGLGGKTGNGAAAPIAWQQGRHGEVIDYCLHDVKLTKQLFDRAAAGVMLANPKGGAPLTLRVPPLPIEAELEAERELREVGGEGGAE